MILLFGSDLRHPCSPAHKSKEAIEEACPTHSVLIGLRMYCSNKSVCGNKCICKQIAPSCIHSLHLHCIVYGQASIDFTTSRVYIHGYLRNTQGHSQVGMGPQLHRMKPYDCLQVSQGSQTLGTEAVQPPSCWCVRQ